MGRGNSFEIIRTKLIYDETARNDTRTSIRKKKRKDKSFYPADTNTGTIGYITSKSLDNWLEEETVEEKAMEYGPYIPTLVRLLDEGYFSLLSGWAKIPNESDSENFDKPHR